MSWAACASLSTAVSATGNTVFLSGSSVTQGPTSVRAWRAVLPSAVRLSAVGRTSEDNVADIRRAGASGAGMGSALYRPGVTTSELCARASRLMSAWQGALYQT